MPFPVGVQTVTVTAGASGYHMLDGTPYAGTFRFTPSVSRVASAVHGVIALGTVNVTLGASGQFTEDPDLLATDAEGFEPSGWTYRVDEEFTNAPGRAYNISLPASSGTVSLPSLIDVEASDGSPVSMPAVLSVNGRTGVVTGLLETASNLSDLASAGAARSNLGLGGAATLNVGTTAGTVAAGNDSRLSDARTPTAHAATHGSGGSDPVTVVQSQVTGLTAALGGKADLAGATFTGGVTVSGADLSIFGTGKGYRLRRGGSSLDLEATGSDLLISNWSGSSFDGTQRSYLRLSADAQNMQIAGKVEVVDSLYGAVKHTIDPITGVASFRTLVVDHFGAPAGYPLGRSGAVESLSVPSSYAGGDDDGTGTDSTGRINLYSYQRANVGSFGENIRNFVMRSDAKTMQAFYLPVQTSDSTGGYNPATRDPKTSGVTWKPVVWQGAHYEANSHTSIHGHWELEIADSTGALQGRLEIPFIDQSKGGGYGATSGQLDGARIGIDYTNIRTNLADLSVRAQTITSGDYTGNGNTALRIGGGNTVPKQLLLSISSDMQASGRRWAVEANTDTESGSNAGTNFRLVRYDDTGVALGTPLFIQRSDGQITNGAAAAKGSRFATVWATSGIHGFSAQPSATIGSAAAFDAQMSAATERAVQATVTGDANRRLVIYADGKHEWGDGTATRDANLYRVAAGRLKTDTALTVGTQLSVGTVPNGSDVVTVSLATDNAGINLTNTLAGGNTSSPLYRGETATSSSLLLTSRVTGDTVTRLAVTAGGVFSWGPGGSTARDVNLYRMSAAVVGTDNSFQVGANLRINTTSVGGGTGVIGLANAGTAPTVNPTGGGVLYASGGALFWRGSSGTVTQLAPA
ncbi:hypothetical protein [Streptomyces sp. NPDC051636]|uniref:hypothetical protein n=1 Tax=Streptomyces sp. NPDC051636 TaxID=3365663 RepID=UPI0037A40188